MPGDVSGDAPPTSSGLSANAREFVPSAGHFDAAHAEEAHYGAAAHEMAYAEYVDPYQWGWGVHPTEGDLAGDDAAAAEVGEADAADERAAPSAGEPAPQ